MRYSLQREIIQKTVYGMNSHPTADHVFELVKQHIPNISLGTVYRNLNLLTESGYLRSIQVGSKARYDGNISEHHHFICNHCNEITDFELVNENFISDLEINNNHKVSEYELIVKGTCTNCKSK